MGNKKKMHDIIFTYLSYCNEYLWEMRFFFFFLSKFSFNFYIENYNDLNVVIASGHVIKLY